MDTEITVEARPAKILTGVAADVYTLRKLHGLTQERFADKVGVSGRTVIRWEQGEPVFFPLLTKLAEMARSKDRLDIADRLEAAGIRQLLKSPSALRWIHTGLIVIQKYLERTDDRAAAMAAAYKRTTELIDHLAEIRNNRGE